jgi:hypothetical protein
VLVRKLGIIDVCGVPYTVLEVVPGENPGDMTDLQTGYVDVDECRIWLRKAPKVRQREVLFHEIVHATLEESGIGRYLSRVTRLDGQSYEDFEEDLVRLLTPTLRTTLRGAVRRFGGLL